MKKIIAILLSLCLAVPVVFAACGMWSEQADAAELTVVTEGGDYDVVVYGATSAGVTAAIAAKKEGVSVLLIAQTDLIGGLTSSGLGATDMANEKVVGGLSYEFYNRMYEYYLDDAAWTSQTREEYFEALGVDIYTGKDDGLRMQWVFEPHVAEQIFREMLADYGVPVIFNERIDLDTGVVMDGTRIQKIVTESGKEFGAKVFIDCSYEGDLMAEAGVTYVVGREANSEYGETMNGILPNNGEVETASPFIVEGDPNSGLLPFIEDGSLGATGSADSRVQAYCFRFTLSTDPDNMVPITKPENYHPEWYETRARILQANPDAGNELTLSKMPNNKTDTNHADFVGMSYEYADGDYLSRKNIEDDHRDYVLGLLYFYAYDERVPLSIREEMRTYGLAKDEFTENGNFPVQIYLREGRRMVSDYVMSQSDVISASIPGSIQKTTAPHSVGQGFYWFDSHRVSYFLIEYNSGSGVSYGYQTDGNFWQSRRDYPISYESIRPKKEECVNLYVPVCLSATHAAYGSIRMETTYMIVAESAGTAAAMSVQEMESNADFCVQDLSYADLAAKLAMNGQLLGDIVVNEGELTDGELAVLKLSMYDLLDGVSADVLYTAVSEEGAFNTPESVGAVQTVLYNAAKKIDPEAQLADTLEVLTKGGLSFNTSNWEALFSGELPASLAKSDVISIFNLVTDLFAKGIPTSYITQWVNYFHDNGIIDAEMRDYFDDHAIKGGTCDTMETRALLMAIARTIEPSVSDGDSALQIYVSTGMIGNTAQWTGIFDGTAAQASGSNLNTLLSRAYNYLSSSESRWQGRIGTAVLDYLVEKGVLDEADTDAYSALLSGTRDGSTVAADTAKAVIVNGAKYFDPAATETDALEVLAGVGVDTAGVAGVMSGTAAEGAAMRSFLAALADALETTLITRPLTESDMQVFETLGILTSTEIEGYIGNAVTGSTVDATAFGDFLSKISSRLTVSGSTYAEKLFTAGAISEAQRDALAAMSGTLDGAMANSIIRSVAEYVEENNAGLSSENVTFLTQNNIASADDALELVSTFGFVPKELAQKLFIGLAQYIDDADPETVTDINTAIDLLADINAISNAQSWKDSFAGEGTAVFGSDCLTIVNLACTFASGTLEDYRYLAENGHITAEEAVYFVRSGNTGRTANLAQVKTLLYKLAAAMDTDSSVSQENAQSIADEFVSSGVTSGADFWLDVLNSAEETWQVENLPTLVRNATVRIRAVDASGGDVSVLSDEVLDYFVEQGFINHATYNKDYFKQNAQAGMSPNKSETRNMLVRAFRAVTGTGASAGQMPAQIDKVPDFTFSDGDSVESPSEERTYWYGFFTTTSIASYPLDGGDVQELMIRIYDYLTGGAQA